MRIASQDANQAPSKHGTTYWHGGFPGLRVGSCLLPPIETGSPCGADIEAAQGLPVVTRRDRVYLVTTEEMARIWAVLSGLAKYGGRGPVYRVEPIGEVEPGPDYVPDRSGDASVMVPLARIVAAYELSQSAMRRVLGRLGYTPSGKRGRS